MKRCPECGSSFSESAQYCDVDGATLLVYDSDGEPVLMVTPPQMDSVSVSPALGFHTPRDGHARRNTAILIATVAAMALGLTLLAGYLWMTSRKPAESYSEPLANEALAQRQTLPLRPAPSDTASPSPEPSPSPSETPSPSPQSSSPRVALSTSPVSTGGDGKTKRELVRIQLTNGTSVEADEVWETGEGVWYRHRGLVTLLDRQQVKAIERANQNASPSPVMAASPAATQ